MHNPKWLDTERERMIAEADRLHNVARALDRFPIVTPQAELNRLEAEFEYRAAARRLVKSAAPWVAAAIIALILISSAAQAPAKVRADLRMIEKMEEMK